MRATPSPIIRSLHGSCGNLTIRRFRGQLVVEHKRTSTWPAGPWLDGWLYRKLLTTSEDLVKYGLTNFPLFLPIANDSDLGAHAAPDGADVRVTLADALTITPHELERFVVTAGQATACIHFLAPDLPYNADQQFYLYYGNPSPTAPLDPAHTWDTKYRWVSHGPDSAPATIADSTSYAHVGNKKSATQPLEVDGDHYKAQHWQTENQWIRLYSPAHLDNLNPLTITHRFRPQTPAYDPVQAIMNKHHWSHNWNYLERDIRWFRQFDTQYGVWHSDDGVVDYDTWHTVSVTYDNSSPANLPWLYVDESYAGRNTIQAPIGTAVSEATYNLAFGAQKQNGTTLRRMRATLASTRISQCIRDPGWLAATHRILSDPLAYITVGPEETAT